MRLLLLALAAGWGSLLATSSARADEAPTQEARLAHLEQEVADLKQAAAAKSGPLRFGGLVQVDWVLHRESSQDEINPATKEPLNEDRFVLRRARPTMVYESKYIESTLTLDANTVRGVTMRPVIAEVTGRWPSATGDGPPLLAVTAGLFRTPFGLEPQQPEFSRLFLERSAVSRGLFSQVFDLGARFAGAYRFLRYSTAIMNGEPLGETGFPGRDPNKNKDLVSRVGVDTEIMHGVQLQLGGSLLTGRGFHAGTPATKDSLVWRDDNENGVVETTELQAVPGKARTPSEGYRRFGMGADLRVQAQMPVLGLLAIQTEIMRGSNLDRGIVPSDPVATGRDLRQLGYYVQASQELTKHFAVGVRYDRYDADQDASEQRVANLVAIDKSFSTWAFAVSAVYAPARITLEYDKNKNPLGRDATGAPATLADDTMTLRVEGAF